MTTIYAVSSGSYSDYTIHCMYDNKEAAEEDVRLRNLNNSSRYDQADIEEWDLNHTPPYMQTTHLAQCWIYPDGSIQDEYLQSTDGLAWDDDDVTLDLDATGDLPVVERVRVHQPPQVQIRYVAKGTKAKNADAHWVNVTGTDEQAVMQSYRDNVARIRADKLGLT